MCSITISTRLFALLTAAAFAGPSTGPAFFLHSDWNYARLLKGDENTARSWSGTTSTGWQDSEGQGIAGIATQVPFLETEHLRVHQEGPLAFFTMEHRGLGLHWAGESAQKQIWGTSLLLQHSHFQSRLIATRGKSSGPNWNLTHSEFPLSHSILRGEWVQEHRSGSISLSFQKKHQGIYGELYAVKTEPSSGNSEYQIQDSSLWLRGEIGGYADAGGLSWIPQLQSLSGNLTLQGIREETNGNRLVAQMRSSWDLQRFSLLIAPSGYRQLLEFDPTLENQRAPYAQLRAPHLQPTPGALSLQIGIQDLRADLFEPSRNSRDESFWGNRLFNPNLEDLYGFSFYRKNVGFWGNGHLQVFHGETTISRRFHSWQPWLAMGIQYWYGEAKSTLRERTTMLVVEEETKEQHNWIVEAKLLLASLGTTWHPRAFPQFCGDLRIQQLAPIGLSLQRNGEQLLSPQQNEQSGQGFHPFQDGFSVNLSFRWQFYGDP